ncbi:MAG: TrkA family potassium uptake protein [Actinomycetota bacterium]|nr:TrkA family potassium uptake protein [Actinomycetota bacterium]
MASRAEIMIVGLGRFGSAAANSLIELGQDVIGVDSESKLVQRYAAMLTEAVEVDATDIDAMRLIGAQDVQTAVVAIGNDIEASILAASVLLELEVPRVWAKAVSDRHGQILERLGVHRVVFPERDMGDRVAHGLVGLALDFVLIGADFAMAETTAPKEALGRTLAEVGLRSKYDVTVVCTKPPGGTFSLTGPDTILKPDDTLLVIGEKENVERFSQLD